MSKPNTKTSTPDPKNYTVNRGKDEAKLHSQSQPAGEPRPKNVSQRGHQPSTWAPAPKAVPVTKPAAAKGKK